MTNLAISDLTMLCTLPIFIYNSLAQGPTLGHQGKITFCVILKFYRILLSLGWYYATGCLVYGFVSGLSGTVSIVTLAGMALERYY